MHGPGYDDPVIDAEEAEKSGLLRYATWADAKEGMHVIYPAAPAGRRSAEIASIEQDGDPRLNRVRTGHDEPVIHYVVQLLRDGQMSGRAVVATEMVYLAKVSEDDAEWPMMKRQTPIIGPPLSEAELKKRKREEAAERRRQKNKVTKT